MNTGIRKSSPSASLIYSRTIHNINDPDGSLEKEINRIAKKLSRAIAQSNTAQILSLQERLVAKCMRFFYVTGVNVSGGMDFEEYEESATQVDELFVDALLRSVKTYDSDKGLFTHMLRNKYKFMRTDAAYAAAKEDTRFGGSTESSPISLQARARKNDDDSTTIEETTGEYDHHENTENPDDALDYLEAYEALEESGKLEGSGVEREPDNANDAIDEAILLKTLALINGFMEKTGKAANQTRKLYTRLFFTEMLTRVVKVRTEGELFPLQRQERNLFGAAELPFQDSYTQQACRSVPQLWVAEFIEEVPPVMHFTDDGFSEPDYGWRLPQSVYISYLTGLGMQASAPLISQQRGHYAELIGSLTPNRPAK